MDIINRLEITEELVLPLERGTLIVLTPPTHVDDLPIIDSSFIYPSYLKLHTPETIFQYFHRFIHNTDEIDIVIMNGIDLGESDNYSYHCDYCKYSLDDDWFYCYHCYSNMCKTCYKETTEEIVFKNGAKNYKDHENKLNQCRQHCQIQPRNIYNIPSTSDRYCDLCKDDIETKFYSTKVEKYISYDICMTCFESNPKAKEEIEIKSMKLIDLKDKKNMNFNFTGFESMLYWFPIISDTQNCNHVFMNLNKEDKNYKKIALQSCDDHGRLGYYIIQNDNYGLDQVLKRLKEICDKGTYEYTSFEKIDGMYKNVIKTAAVCSDEYSSPIQILMIELGMSVFFG